MGQHQSAAARRTATRPKRRRCVVNYVITERRARYAIALFWIAAFVRFEFVDDSRELIQYAWLCTCVRVQEKRSEVHMADQGSL